MGKCEMINLGLAGEFASKSRIKAGAGKDDGKYKFFTSSNEQSKFLDEDLYDFPALIFGTGGNASVHYCDTPFSTSTDCLVFYSKNPRINLKMIYGFLSGNMHLLEEGFKGAGLKHISKKYLPDNIFVPKFEVNEQIYISDVLDRASSLIEKRKTQIEKLDLLVKSQFIEMFGNPADSKSYSYVPFADFMERCVDIGSNGANQVVVEHLDMKDQEDYALMVRTVNFTANDFLHNTKYISKKAYDFFKKSQVYGGEIIFNKIGSAGINFIMPELKRPVSLGLNQIMVTPKNINTQYLYRYLNTAYGTYQIQSRVQGAVTKSIQKTELKKIPILYPPITLQNQFADFVKRVEAQKSLLQESLAKLEFNYKSLMQKCFRGEVSRSDDKLFHLSSYAALPVFHPERSFISCYV